MRMVPRCRSGTAHETGSDRRASTASRSGPYACSTRSTSSRGAVELAGLGAHLERAAELGELGGAERRAVRLQRVRRPAQLLGAPFVERAAEGRDQLRRVREEGVDHLAEELVAAEVAQVLERAVVEADVLDRLGAAVRVRAGLGTLERRHELLGADRLRDVVVHAGREARLAILGERVRRHRDDVRAALGRPALADPARRVEAVELRHLDVHQDDVVRPALERLDRLEPVVRDVGAVAELLEEAQRDLLVHRVVLREQDAKPRPGALSVCHGLDLLFDGAPREQAQERVVELRRLERLCELGGEEAARLGLRQPAERREEQERQLLGVPPVPDLAGQREPVHPRHHHVEHADVERLVARDQLERRGGQLDRDGLHPPRPRVPGDDLAVGRVVVDDEDPLAGEVREAVVECDLCRHIRRGRGQRDAEGRSLPLLALDADRAAHQLDEALRDGEPEAGAAEAARRRRVHLAERGEEQVHPVGRDPDARVADCELDLVRACSRSPRR